MFRFRWLRALATLAETRDRMTRLETLPAVEAPPVEAASVEPSDPSQELDKVRAEVATLRGRVVALSGDTDEDDLLHNNLAGLYRNLVTQQLRELARLRWARVRGDRPVADGPMAQARMVRELIRLTIVGGADEQDVTEWLLGGGVEPTGAERRAVEGACGQARRLATGLAGTGKPAAFVENVPRGKPLAEGAGRPWASCPPDGKAAFVVAPAYVLRGRVLTEPLVFTEDDD